MLTGLRQAILALGPVLYWHCTERGGSLAYDLGGSARHGTVGAGVTMGVTGLDHVAGTAFRFAQSSTGNVALADIDGLPTGNAPRTLILRYRTGYQPLGTGALFGYGENGVGSRSFNLIRTSEGNDRLRFWSWGNDVAIPISGLDIADGAAHTVCLAYDGGTTLTLYVDGVGASATIGILDTGDGPLRMGQNTNGDPALPNEVMGHFAIVPYAITPEQAAVLHAAATTDRVLPQLRVSWLPVEPTEGETFVQYNVYRDGLRIAVVNDLGVTSYLDHLAVPRTQHAYTVTWTANVSGDVLESEPQDAPVAASVAFRGGWLHEVATPDLASPLLVREAGVTSDQEVTYRRARGRSLPSAFVGAGRGRDLRLTPAPESLADPALWAFLRELQARQFEAGALLCLRLGYREGERYFVQLDGLEEQHGSGLDRVRLGFREVHLDEEV